VSKLYPELERALEDAYKRDDHTLIVQTEHEIARREKTELLNHPHTKLIETCNPSEFEPNLMVFDRMVDSLVVR
jgi:hypothetical protein